MAEHETSTGIALRKMREEIEAPLNAEIARLNELLRGVGANRYWEGRWRDADRVLKGMDEIIARLRREKEALVELLREARSQHIAGTPYDISWDTRRDAALRSASAL